MSHKEEVEGSTTLTRRQKHRRQVKRFEQRRSNREVRTRAQERDCHLFLFAETLQNAREASWWYQQQQQQHQRNGDLSTTTVAAAGPEGAGESCYRHLVPASGEDVDIVFQPKSMAGGALDLLDPGGDFSCSHETAIVPPSFYSEVGDCVQISSVGQRHGACGGGGEEVEAKPIAAMRVMGALPSSAGSFSGNTAGATPVSNSARASPSPPAAAASSTASPSSSPPPPTTNISTIQVRRVEGVPAISVRSPLLPGTNLNVPPRNYLTLDPMHNVHQHAPGFERDTNAALRSMMVSAVAEWKEVKERVPIISTGTAMKSVFEQLYTPDKPLALQVRRVGPTLVIDAHSNIPTTVKDMQARALFGKTLYRLEEEEQRTLVPATDVEEVSNADNVNLESMPTTTTGGGAMVAAPSAYEVGSAAVRGGAVVGRRMADIKALNEGSSRALALPQQRVGSGVVTKHIPAVNRYSQILRWDIDALEVLVGVDTPVMLDSRSGMEQMLKLQDASAVPSAVDIQRESLSCWFEAMLANVPQVGIYVHKAGVVQSFEVKKAQELLGLVEGRTAAAAMNFTSNVLQWLVSNCVKDNGSYAVIRGYGSDYLELFELPETKDTFGSEFTDCPELARGSREKVKRSCGASASSPLPEDAQETKRREEVNQLRVSLAHMRYGMGEHLVKEGGPQRADEAMWLLLNSFAAFIAQSRTSRTTERLYEIVQMLPALTSRIIAAHQSPGVAVSTPAAAAAAVASGGRKSRVGQVKPAPSSLPTPQGALREKGLAAGFHEGLVMCCSFETLLRRALEDLTVAPEVRTAYARCLVPCSAALCVVVSRTLEACCAERGTCAKRKCPARAEVREKRKAGANEMGGEEEEEEDSEGNKGSQRARALVRVAVEGLMRLERINSTLEHFMESRLPLSSLSRGVKCASKTREAEPSAAAAGTLVDPRVDMDITPLTSALCELYGDVVLLAMADTTAFTAETLAQVSTQLLAQQQEQRHEYEKGEEWGDAEVVDGEAKQKKWEPRVDDFSESTTLRWLSAITPDIICLSFTALRFYTKAGTHSERQLLKTAQTYYYVGLRHYQTDRYTKALEALHRARSLFEASLQAPKDTVFGGCFVSTDMVCATDVQRALGTVFLSMATLKGRAASAGATIGITAKQPLSIGPVHLLAEEEEKFLRMSLNAFTQAGAETCSQEKARVLVQYAAALTSAATVKGAPLDNTAAKHVHQMLQEATVAANAAAGSGSLRCAGMGTASGSARWRREFEVLRLVSATETGQHPSALLKEAEALVARWASEEGASSTMESDARGKKKRCTAAAAAGGGGSSSSNSTAPVSTSLQAGVTADGISVVERELQLALTCCVLAEEAAVRAGKVNARSSGSGGCYAVLQWVRKTAAYLVAAIAALEQLPASERTSRLKLSSSAWAAQSGEAWAYRMCSMISLRALRASTGVRALGAKSKEEASTAFNAIMALELSGTQSTVTTKTFMTRLKALSTCLGPLLKW